MVEAVAMLELGDACQFGLEATTGLGITAAKVVLLGNDCLSAVAATLPAALFVGWVGQFSEYGQTAVSPTR